MTMHKLTCRIACGLAFLVISTNANAHFVWLKSIDVDGRPHAFLYFGEGVQDEAYHLPERMAGVDVWRRVADGKREKLATKPLDTTGRIGLVAPISDGPRVLEASRQYGLYHGMLLTYYAKHVAAASDAALNAAGASKELTLDMVPRIEGSQIRLTILWNGKPLANAKATITIGDAEPADHTANADGVIALKADRGQLMSVLANHTDGEAKGDVDGEAYTSAAHFATLTFTLPAEVSAEQIVPPLPAPLASFGAAVADGWLYVYGGHTGEPHDHSAANLSKYFRRSKLNGGRDWENLPMQTPLQGLPLVAHGARLYRIGGVSARNATTDEEEDMHSTNEFSSYDPATREWTALAPLPAPRSSHDAVVIGDKLYVVGGWTLAGPGKRTWLDDALVFDFAKPEAGWQTFRVPFHRRALAVGEWRGKVVVIGGIDEDGAVTEEVSIFDASSGKWTDSPPLPAGDLAGFGASAWNLDGSLYVSGLPGDVYCLSSDGTKWEPAARLKVGRFFHRLLPAGRSNMLLAIAGAAEDGHVADSEVVELPRGADQNVK